MFISTIIPTIGRDTLARAVNSVLDQDCDEIQFELIVVNDSGKKLPKEDWMKSDKIKIVDTNRVNRSIARNTGAAIARGRYLHFLDDDDWMLPGAFKNLIEIAQDNSSQMGWIFGGFRLVTDHDKFVKDIYPLEQGNCSIQMLAFEWIPLQASIINTHSFFEVGGFLALPILLGGFEDIHLSREIALSYEFAGCNNLVTCIRFGDEQSTTDYDNLINQNRCSREKMLSSIGVFSRLAESIVMSERNQAYWYNRLIYYYLASAKWNLRTRNFTTVASRLIFALIGILISWRQIFNSEFWQSFRRPHYNLVRRTTIDFENLFPNTRWQE